jgi:small subunit ribosomal protein S24e
MDIEINSKRNNLLLRRMEVHFTVRHENEGTPNREIIRTVLAEKLNVKKENILVNHIHSGFGVQESKGYAKIYKKLNEMKAGERDHILLRNTIITKEKKEKEKTKPEKPEAPPKEKEEKPTDQPEEKKEQQVSEDKPKDNKKPDTPTNQSPKESDEPQN